MAAGVGTRTRSYEPRCLLKYKDKTIVENQLEVIFNKFNKCEVTIVGGFDINKIIKKVGKNARFVENQLFDTTNSGESLRLGVNNSNIDNILFLHGDLVISPEIFDNINERVDLINLFELKSNNIRTCGSLNFELPPYHCCFEIKCGTSKVSKFLINLVLIFKYLFEVSK